MYIVVMEIIWDPKKAESNFHNHKVRFADAETVLFDPMALTIADKYVEGEKRFVTLGLDAMGRLIVLVYTYRDDNIRLVSARKARPSEREYYEKGI